MSLLPGIAIPPTDYNLTNSLRFRASASAFLSRTPASAGNRTTWTWSAWIKRGTLGTVSRFLSAGSASTDAFGFLSGDTFQFFTDSIGQNLVTSQVFRDPSAWYHFVIVNDTTQATASNRVKIYVNGSQITAFGTATYPAQNSTGTLNSATAHNIGRRLQTAGEYFDGYMDEINFIDGQALTPSSFGFTNATTGVWQPARYSGTYGTNGYYLNFTNIALTSGSNTGLGQDFSGNGNFWNTNNISVTAGATYDAMSDVPTLTSTTAANYANFSGTNLGTFANATITEAGLRVSVSSGGTPDGGKAYAPFGMSDGTGKWYFEMTCIDPGAGNQRLCFGIANITTNPNAITITNPYIASASGAHGNFNIGTFTTGDVMQVAYDTGTNRLWFGKNNVWFNSGNPAAGTTPLVTVTSGITYAPFTHYASSGQGPGIGAWNFGQRPFAYTPPSGFVALNTFNLPTSTIVKGNIYMDATTYTGNGGTQTITNAGGFRPDLVWQKSRSSGTNWNNLIDVVRGVGNRLFSNSTDPESFAANSLTSFNSNGFSVGAALDWNTNGSSNVAWQWQAGSSTVTNNSGSITSQVRANTTSGFSIVTYTGNGSNGSTIGHGLGVAPAMIIVKRRNSSGWWGVYNRNLPAGNVLILQNTGGQANDSTYFTVTAPTSVAFSVGTTIDTNASGGTYVAYCWAEIAGFSRFGSYTGNGSADGPFVFTGFMPKYLMIKSSSIAGEWAIYDVPRDLYNPMGLGGGRLRANTADAETGADSAQYIDFLSNGFKIRNISGFDNQSGATYIYMAFASNPFKNSNAF